MADDDKTLDETPEDTPAESAEPAPVAEEQDTDTAPVDEAAAAGTEGETPAEEPERAEEPAAEQSEEPAAEEPAPAEEPEREEVPAAEQAEEPAAEQAEEPAAEQAEDAAPAEESPPAEEPAPPAREARPEEPKKDVIPGADLEPIAVEPQGPELSAEERASLEAEEEERARREAELAATEAESGAASRAPAKMESDSRFLATGKRKSSIARVTLVPGDGKFEINKRGLEEFFPRPLHQTMVRQPLAVSGYEGSVDVRVRVHGGGVSGQAGAVRHGISRALTEIDAELRGDLKRRGFLTRDARVKERKKAGLKKARKRPQFSKR
jgi:small subunit ribosomal protein S9